MNKKTRIVGVYYRQPKYKPEHILVTFSDDSTVRFFPGEMSAAMRKIRLRLIKLTVINNKAYELAMKNRGEVPPWMQELLCEYQIAAQEMGAKLFVPPTGKEGQS